MKNLQTIERKLTELEQGKPDTTEHDTPRTWLELVTWATTYPDKVIDFGAKNEPKTD
jgi:hypothetical protein